MNNSYIKHVGVLGMHWGRRKSRAPYVKEKVHYNQLKPRILTVVGNKVIGNRHPTKEALLAVRARRRKNAAIIRNAIHDPGYFARHRERNQKIQDACLKISKVFKEKRKDLRASDLSLGQKIIAKWKLDKEETNVLIEELAKFD